MSAKPQWLLAIPDAISQIEQLDRILLTRRGIKRLFGDGKVRRHVVVDAREASGSATSPRSTWPPTSGRPPGRPHGEAAQVLPVNPAAAVRGAKHVVTKGATPVLSPAEARKLLETIDTGVLAGLRNRALLSVMLYSFACG